MSRALLTSVLLALLLPAVRVDAQVVSGVALDSAGRPVPDIAVALHRVGGTSAMSVATDVTDADGRFRFEVQAVDSAVYFAAMRLGESLYIGAPVRAGVERVEDYRLQAGPSTEAGAVASALAGAAPPRLPGQAPPPDPGAGAAWIVLFLAVGAATAFVLAAPAYRRRKRRDLLIELAMVENSLDDPAFQGERDALAERSASLREQLSPAD